MEFLNVNYAYIGKGVFIAGWIPMGVFISNFEIGNYRLESADCRTMRMEFL